MFLKQYVHKYSKATSQKLQKFWSEEDGAIAIFVALFFLTLVLCTGIYLDYHRVRTVRNEMQLAMDRAVLTASRRTLGGSAGSRSVFGEQVFRGGLLERTREWLDRSGSVRISVIQKLNEETREMEDTWVKGEARVYVPLFFGRFMNKPDMEVNLESISSIATGKIRNGDFVFVIDATTSMENTFKAVRDAALTFRNDFDKKMIEEGQEPFDGMRIRIIFFRDFLTQFVIDDILEANNKIQTMNASIAGQDNAPPPMDECDAVCQGVLLEGTGYVSEERRLGNPPPGYESWGAIHASDFFDLDDPGVSGPGGRLSGTQQFVNFVYDAVPFASGDSPEFGLQGLYAAMTSDWSQRDPGKTIPIKELEIEKSYRIIVLWTDAAAYPLPDRIPASGNYQDDPALRAELLGRQRANWERSDIVSWNAIRRGIQNAPMPKSYQEFKNLWARMNLNNRYQLDKKIKPILVYFLEDLARSEIPANFAYPGESSGRYGCSNFHKSSSKPCENGYYKAFLSATDSEFPGRVDGGDLAAGNTNMIEILVNAVKEDLEPPRLLNEIPD